MREVRRQVRHLRFLRSTLHFGENLRRVQLRKLPGTLRDLRWSWSERCILLQGVHDSGERQGWLSKDREPGIEQDRFVLRAKEVRIQATLINFTCCNLRQNFNKRFFSHFLIKLASCLIPKQDFIQWNHGIL